MPKIRFAGFTVAWERRRLGDVAMRIVRKNKNLESTLPLTISSLHGLVDQITYFNNRVASRDVSNYYLVKRGEFAYNKSYSDGFPWGSIKRLDRYEMGVLSTLYIVFALNTGIVDSDYLVTYYETNNWHNEIAIRAAEGARNHGLLNISAEDFFDTAIRFPKDIAEQAKIGDLFASLDHLLTIHQREYDKLVAVKKALLQKMFAVTGQIQKLNIVKGGLASVEKTPGSMEKLSENSLDEAAVGQDISNQELNSYPNFPHGAF
ncbi:hypothetical protein FACS189418_1630 [Clostridia bacterium]|nr:hypothetical protein FACS189418_1630 [Clostridia bacterium]